MPLRVLKFFLFFLAIAKSAIAQELNDTLKAAAREHINIDLGWRFALGHQSDFTKDFYHNTSYFTYLAKTGYGDGAASPDFEDRAWREVDLPHDWAIELPLSPNASKSHGYKVIGWQYPENSVGWYRKKIFIPKADFGRVISLQFDGIYRNAVVWLNGFYLGNEPSGYSGSIYEISDYINYGGDNIISVRVDASVEEGWFYEGAGIYRHVWLNKSNQLHVDNYGTYITSEISGSKATLTIRSTIVNNSSAKKEFELNQLVYNANHQAVGQVKQTKLSLNGKLTSTYFQKLDIDNPVHWSIDNPYLYSIETQIKVQGKIVDSYYTKIGIRTIRFDPDRGFFLNGNNLKIKGVNNHQDHAGVGVAISDELQEFRIKILKGMGCNAIRTAHNPPTPELLDICDRLGLLVLDENRLMGINQVHFDLLKKLIIRDRNHPCVVLWSLGNEEWRIEGGEKGELITKTMQDFAQTLDSSRAFTVAISGGWDWGSGKSALVMGYNYIVQGNIDEHHKKFPWQCSIGTEESNTIGSRGIYVDDKINGHLAAINRMPENVGTEHGWRFYQERPFLSGLFYWTGFDYHGEPYPIYWPQVNTQFGLLDLCGYPKDIFYYLKSWWGNQPVVHISQHWNHTKEYESLPNGTKLVIKMPIYSNAEEVELLLNNKSLGKRKMPINGHIDWTVNYSPGVLIAKGYTKEKPTCQDRIETTKLPEKIVLTAHKSKLVANGMDVAIISIQATDYEDKFVPDANNEITFRISGPGRIIGVGNGDPASHDPEQYVESVKQLYLSNLSYKLANTIDNDYEAVNSNTPWFDAFASGYGVYETNKKLIIKGSFVLDDFDNNTSITFFAKSLAENQSIYLNGFELARNIVRDDPNQTFQIHHEMLKKGENTIIFAGVPFLKRNQWEEINTNPGTIKVVYPASAWKCKLFNGLGQVLVRTTLYPGEVELIAESGKLKKAKLSIATY